MNQITTNVTKNRDKNVIKFLFFLFLSYSMYTFFGGDASRYEQFVTKDYKYIDNFVNAEHEQLYVIIAAFVQGNFFLWKLLIYGVSLLLVYKSIKRLNCNNYITMLSFVIFALFSFGATRAVLAYTIFLYGLSFLDNKKYFSTIIGLSIMSASIFAHSSMALLLALIPFAYLRLTKKRVIIILAIFPAIVIGFNFLIPYLMSNVDMFGMSGHKLEVYTDDSMLSNSYNQGVIIETRLFIEYILVAWSIYLLFKAENLGTLPDNITKIGRICFFLFYISLVIRFSALPNNTTIFTRYILMTCFFIFATWSYLINNNKLRKCSNINLYVYFAIFCIWFKMFGVAYYTLDQ